jgi:putative ATPase
MENQHAPLLNEILRPKTLGELNLSDVLIARLERMERSGFPMNMIFYGKPGIGKSSAARVLVQNSDVLELNGSHNSGDKRMVNTIESFCSTMSLIGLPKVVYIDEADFMSKVVQDALRYTIEQMSDNARFVLTANNFSKLTPAIRSRCLGICFDVEPANQIQVVERMTGRYRERLDDLGIIFDYQRLKEIVGIYFPDLRMVANQIQFEFGC